MSEQEGSRYDTTDTTSFDQTIPTERQKATFKTANISRPDAPLVLGGETKWHDIKQDLIMEGHAQGNSSQEVKEADLNAGILTKEELEKLGYEVYGYTKDGAPKFRVKG